MRQIRPNFGVSGTLNMTHEITSAPTTRIHANRIVVCTRYHRHSLGALLTDYCPCVRESYPSGGKWLLPLLHLGSHSAGRLKGIKATALRPDHARWWGKNERRLNPPISLLRWLVKNACAPTSVRRYGGSATRAKREHLVARTPEVIEESLRLLLKTPVPLACLVRP
jgi:hypothetical protein